MFSTIYKYAVDIGVWQFGVTFYKVYNIGRPIANLVDISRLHMICNFLPVLPKRPNCCQKSQMLVFLPLALVILRVFILSYF